MMLTIDPENNVPLVDQIVAGVRARIEDRALAPGSRLPSIRKFASEHKVSRFTVVEAYDRLVAMGYLQSRRGSGFYAATRGNAQPGRDTVVQPEHALDVAWLFRRFLDEGQSRVLAGGPWLPEDWMDDIGLRRNLRALTRANGSHMLGYGNPKGYKPLREQLHYKLADLGIATDQEQIILTHGVSQGLDLLMRSVLTPGDVVLVDDPGYYNFFANLRAFGVRLLGVPRNVDGPDIPALTQLAETHRPKIFFTQSTLHNPTSTDVSPAVAFRLLQAAEKFDFLVVEDDVFCDLQPASQRLATMDQLNRVVYISSFSKTLSGSLRVGYLAASRDIAERVTDIKMLSCITSSQFAERLVYQMLVDGHYRKLVERLKVRLDDVRNKAMKSMSDMGMEIFAEASAGMFLWARFPQFDDAAELSKQAYDKGVVLAPGAVFRPNMDRSPWMRFNITMFDNPELKDFLRSVA